MEEFTISSFNKQNGTKKNLQTYQNIKFRQKKQENKITEKKTEKKHGHQQGRPVQTRCDDQVFLFVVF